MRSSCVLDLALRLLLLWTSAEAHDVAANWVTELVKLAGQGKAPHTAAVKGMSESFASLMHLASCVFTARYSHGQCCPPEACTS